MSNKSILFRELEDPEEYNIAKDIIGSDLYKFTSQIPNNSMVIGRYSVLPFYQYIEEELKQKNCYLINSYDDHLYIADIQNWYYDLKDFTPKTYFMWDGLKDSKQSFVIKGKTNSRKFDWNTKMFAKTGNDLIPIIKTLLDDSLISQQGLCVREFVDLETYDIGINGLPFTNEWRCFFRQKDLIAYGYYWSIYEGERQQDIDKNAFTLLEKVSDIVSEFTNAFVLDIAKTKSGEWIVIELNDFQQSGLSTIDPESFYKSIKQKML